MIPSPATYLHDLNTALSEGWRRFWFTPSSARPLAAVRLVAGALTCVALASYWPDLERWFSADGMLPLAYVRELYPAQPTPLDWLSPVGLRMALVAAMLVTALFTAGVGGRVLALATWIAAGSFFQRASLTSGPFEAVMIMLLAYLCIGRACDSATWRTLVGAAPRFPAAEASASNTIALRLIQIHVALIHLMMGVAQLSAEGGVWFSGEGMWLAAANPETGWFDFSWLTEWPRLAAGWSHLVTLQLLAFGVLSWQRLLAPILLVTGGVIWLSVAAATGQTLFALAMWGGTLAVLGPESRPSSSD